MTAKPDELEANFLGIIALQILMILVFFCILVPLLLNIQKLEDKIDALIICED